MAVSNHSPSIYELNGHFVILLGWKLATSIGPTKMHI